ncbi:MAG: hypothetical protein ASARMPRED_008372 [Alectoria sarmentosa]|nr:MAG: hypothetical protein ASARMPRED_008372 [Alectoria sarmentosa]
MHANELPICTACGSQFDADDSILPEHCQICDDPRQFVPASGQSWTTLTELKASHKNKWLQDSKDPHVWSIWTEPKVGLASSNVIAHRQAADWMPSKFGIGQRCFLLETEAGNVLWDMIALLDESTIEFINSKGGLKAIVISHPHYYTTYTTWAQAFKCPVYMSADDQKWLCQKPPTAQTLRLVSGHAGTAEQIVPGVTAIKTGGHFPGSLVLHWEKKLFIADTIVTVPSAHTPHPRPPNQTSYSFQWSIPNMIPLPPSEMLNIWRAIEPYGFDTTHGAFGGMDVRDQGLKARMLESMKIQTRGEGWERHEMLDQVI